MAAIYAATDALSSQKPFEAWAARYQWMADLSTATDALNAQRAIEAWAARYQGMADISQPKMRRAHKGLLRPGQLAIKVWRIYPLPRMR